jgi:hypothetical protein
LVFPGEPERARLRWVKLPASRRAFFAAVLPPSGVLAFFAVLVLSAGSVQTAVKEKFSFDFTCPVERIEVRDRSDIKPSDFKVKDPPPLPPPEVAADPARLALWRERNPDRRSDVDFDNLLDIDNSVEEARGCNRKAMYRCDWDSGYLRDVTMHRRCRKVDPPPGATHW